MSKVDAMRALREARMAAAPSRPAAPSTPAAAKAVNTTKAARPTKRAVPTAAGEGAPERCGHRSISNKSCTRDAGHAEKNHRYS